MTNTNRTLLYLPGRDHTHAHAYTHIHLYTHTNRQVWNCVSLYSVPCLLASGGDNDSFRGVVYIDV